MSMGRFLKQTLLLLTMCVGALLFFIGALGVINRGFKGEVPGALLIALLGLALMVGAKLADRPPRQGPKP